MLSRPHRLCGVVVLLAVPTLARAQSDTVPINKDVPASTPFAALAGKMAGVRVTTVSGRPFAQPAVEMRAPAGRFWGADPLVIVDGSIASVSLEDAPMQYPSLRTITLTAQLGF